MYSHTINTLYDLVDVDNKLAGLPVFPLDYKGELPPAPFIKYGAVFSPTKQDTVGGLKRLAGSFLVSIYAPSGRGQLPFAEISELLNTIFEKRLLSDGLQTSVSSIQYLGQDKNDPSLSRADYSVNFLYFGE